MAAATTVTATPTQQKQTGFQKFLHVAKIILIVIMVLIIVASVIGFGIAIAMGGGMAL